MRAATAGRALHALALAPALLLASLAGCAGGSAGPPAVRDASGYFYDAPGPVPERPGVLLRSQPFTAGVPPDGRAWRILYTTTSADGAPALASAVVLAPAQGAATPRALIAWAHPTTGVARRCAPSLLGGNEPFYAGIPSVEGVLREGWALVATDYPGLGTAGATPYLVGPGEARSVLDSVRAARQLSAIRLSGETVVWGHSQGGHAALWTGMLAPSYAPDVKLAGVAAMAPVSEPGPLLAGIGESPTSQALLSYAVSAYSRIYPDVRLERYVQPGAAPIVRSVAGRCLEGADPAVPYLEGLSRHGTLFATPPFQGALGRRLAQNEPTRPIAAPLLIAQGLADDLVTPAIQGRYVRERCAAGQSLEYRTYSGRTHTSLTEEGSPLIGDLFEWTRLRLAGAPQAPGCRTVAR
ncbi:MAG: lipase family protein [Solirubrobacteraceae bacterium]